MVEHNGPEQAGSAEDLDPDACTWAPGVDYLAPWRAARDAAGAVNLGLSRNGVSPQEMKAVADAGGLVQLKGTPAGARKLVRLLEEMARPGRGAA